MDPAAGSGPFKEDHDRLDMVISRGLYCCETCQKWIGLIRLQQQDVRGMFATCSIVYRISAAF